MLNMNARMPWIIVSPRRPGRPARPDRSDRRARRGDDMSARLNRSYRPRRRARPERSDGHHRRDGGRSCRRLGPAGPAGAQGAAGQTGAQGSSLPGPAGPMGRTGPAGVQGVAGSAGAQGPTTVGPTGQPKPESEKVTDRRVEIQRAMGLIQMQKYRDRGDRSLNVRCRTDLFAVREQPPGSDVITASLPGCALETSRVRYVAPSSTSPK